MQGTTQKQVLKNWMVAKYSLPPSTQTHEEKLVENQGSRGLGVMKSGQLAFEGHPLSIQPES